jgi:hypothetical protein
LQALQRNAEDMDELPRFSSPIAALFISNCRAFISKLISSARSEQLGD